MPTLNEYAYNIKNIARGGQGNSDDDNLGIKQIKFWIQGYRASGIFLTTDYGKDIDPQLIQDLGVYPLTEVDKADSSCPDVDWGCTIRKVEIPKLIDFPKLRALEYVGLINKQSSFEINYPTTAPFKKATRFGELTSRVYLINQTLYFLFSEEHSDLQYVNIRGVFENPEDVSTFPVEGCDQKCYDPAIDQYPMPARLYEEVLVKILRNELNWTQQAIEDELNDGREQKANIR